MPRCEKGPCVPASSRCNNQPDCKDASDEKNCPKAECSAKTSGVAVNLAKANPKDLRRLISCANTTACILPEWLCDGENDCWDNSDELVNYLSRQLFISKS